MSPLEQDDFRWAFINALKPKGCAMCERSVTGLSLDVSVMPPVSAITRPNWSFCSLDCLHLFTEGAAEAGIDVEWLHGTWGTPSHP